MVYRKVLRRGLAVSTAIALIDLGLLLSPIPMSEKAMLLLLLILLLSVGVILTCAFCMLTEHAAEYVAKRRHERQHPDM